VFIIVHNAYLIFYNITKREDYEVQSAVFMLTLRN